MNEFNSLNNCFKRTLQFSEKLKEYTGITQNISTSLAGVQN